MRAEVRELEGTCGEEDRADQPCGSASSDSNSNGEVQRRRQNGVASTNTSPNGRSPNHLASPASADNASGVENVSPPWSEVVNQREKKFKEKQKKRMATMVMRNKRKSGGEDRPIDVNNHHYPVAAASDDSSDDEGASAIPGPSTATDIDFGYEPTQVVPWATKSYYPLSIDGLHDEIVDCWQWLKPTRLETAVRYKVYERVRYLIEHYWYPVPVRVSVFGSLRTRLFLPSSDIDVLVECDEWLHYTDSEMITEVMQKTLMCLQVHLEKLSFHPGAFVPIIKLEDPDTRLNIDISFNTVQGVKAATYMEQVKAEFPVLEPLLLLLKQYVFQNKLHEAYTGGLSSYGISLMLVNFFQIHYPQFRRRLPEGDGVNLGYLLMRFLEVYGHELNYSAVAIDPSINRYRKRPPECPPRPSTASEADGCGALDADGAASVAAPSTEAEELRDSKMKKTPILLSVHDPLQEGNEVCRSSFNIYSVRTLFQSALVQLRAVFVCDRPGSMLWRKKVYKGTMLGRLLHFAPSQINFRYWLKGFVLSPREIETPPVKTANGRPLILYGSLLSDSSDMTPLTALPRAGHKVLEIVRPDERPDNSGAWESRRREEERREQENMRAAGEQRVEYTPSDLQQQQQQMRRGGGGQVNGPVYYNRYQGHQREYRNGGQRTFHNHNHQQHHYQQAQHQPLLQQLQPPRQQQHQSAAFAATAPGTYHSKTWERPTGGYGRRMGGDNQHRNRSRSSEMLSEHCSAPFVNHGVGAPPSRQQSPLSFEQHRQQTAQQLYHQQYPAPSATAPPTAAPAAAAAASVAASASYKRSDSAVSSCSTTVIGNSRAFTTASSSVSSPALNGYSTAATSGPGSASGAFNGFPPLTTATTTTTTTTSGSTSTGGSAAFNGERRGASGGRSGSWRGNSSSNYNSYRGSSNFSSFRPTPQRAYERPLRAVHAAGCTQGCRGCSCCRNRSRRGSSNS